MGYKGSCGSVPLNMRKTYLRHASHRRHERGPGWFPWDMPLACPTPVVWDQSLDVSFRFLPRSILEISWTYMGREYRAFMFFTFWYSCLMPQSIKESAGSHPRDGNTEQDRQEPKCVIDYVTNRPTHPFRLWVFGDRTRSVFINPFRRLSVFLEIVPSVILFPLLTLQCYTRCPRKVWDKRKNYISGMKQSIAERLTTN